jgi:hypothetical protein
MAPTPIEEKEFPCYYIDSDKASGKAQNAYKGFTWAALSLMFVSTILVSFAPEVTAGIPGFDKINGIILFAGGFVSLLLTLTEPEKRWYLGRAIAESIKTLTWRYMMHAEPFIHGNDQADLDNFTDRIQAINQQANEDKFIPKPNKNHREIITAKMKQIRGLDFLERKAYYAENRIENQIEWYSDKSERSRKRARNCSILLIGFQFLAGLYLFQFFDTLKVFNVNNVMVFLATSIIGIVEMNKYKELHQSYAFTNQELNIIRTKFGSVNDEAELNQFVIEAEQAISREHTMWLARRLFSNTKHTNNHQSDRNKCE